VTSARSVRLSAAIMSHPRRAAAARALAASLPELSPTVVFDPSGSSGTLATARLAWATVGPGATHHLVLQDDALPCEDFAERVRDAITDHPVASLSFFDDWGGRTANMVRIAAMRGHRWAEVATSYVPAQALVLPAAHAATFASFACPDDTPDDVALYEHTRGLPRYVQVPNLADHDDMVSLTGNHPMGVRRSSCFTTDPSVLATGSGVTEGLTIVPTPSWASGAAEIHVRRPGGGDWYVVTGLDLLRHHRITASDLENEFDAARAVLPAKAARLLERWLWELWLTSVALGVAAASGGHAADTRNSTARTALSTLAPGVLRLFVDVSDLAAVEGAVTGFVQTGADAGIAWCRKGTVTSFGDADLPAEYFAETSGNHDLATLPKPGG